MIACTYQVAFDATKAGYFPLMEYLIEEYFIAGLP